MTGVNQLISVNKMWQRDNEKIEIEKNHSKIGYFIDVQGLDDTKKVIKSRVMQIDGIACQWNTASNLCTTTGEVLTIRSIYVTFGGEMLLNMVEQQLLDLGFTQIS